MAPQGEMTVMPRLQDQGNRPSAPVTLSKAKVLIVDDEPAVGALVESVLRPRGFDCRTCTSGQDALAVLEGQNVDAIISDLRMPGLSGLGLLRKVRPHHPHLAFLMMTGVNDLSAGIEAMKEGSDDYLVKPLPMEEVVRGLARALERKNLERELAGYRQRLEEMVDQRTRQLRAAMKRVEHTYDETLRALGAALDLRDNETAGHSYRVMRYSVEIARQMGCPDAQITNIARGAFLHDIGKIGVPDAILRKPAKLTQEETAVMQTHVRIGYDLVCRIAFLSGAAEIVLTHHERYDGTGYPQGLAGIEIPLGSRIFVVADTLDAMTSDRPYRKALSFSTACDEILRESGRQFDPQVVNAFQRIGETVIEQIRHGHPAETWEFRQGETAPARELLDRVAPFNSLEGNELKLDAAPQEL